MDFILSAASTILIYLTFISIDHVFSKREKAKSKGEMECIDNLINDAIRGERTPSNKYKNKNKTI